MSDMFLRLIFQLFLFLKTTEAIELKIFDDLLEVRSQSGLFYPLCFNSFHQKYGEQACASISSKFSSHSPISLKQYTYSIGCTSSICFTFLSSFCKTGVKIVCSSHYCAPGTLQVGTKCLLISTNPVQGYSEAIEYCSPFSLITSLKPTELESLRDTTLPFFSDSRLFFSSGLRQGSTWKWKTGENVEQNVHGTGRCLALHSGYLEAINCDSEAYVICEFGRECIGRNRTYTGSTNRTSNGQDCLRWDDPAVLFERDAKVDIVSHNYCRFIKHDGKMSTVPVCYVKPNELAECGLPNCPETLNDIKSQGSEDNCPLSSFSCDNGSKCISEKFQCDYEVDCVDGTDEQNCENYLENYELIGAYRLAENIIEVWTFIPHVQGCARKCLESLLMCESFSYESKTQTCLLTDISQIDSGLVKKITSLYYRRRFSSKDVLFQVDNDVLYATKQSQKGQVCDDNFSREKLSTICRVLGFGCSLCQEAACLNGDCIRFDQLCDGNVDCPSRDDESDCKGKSFRLTNGSDTSGYVEVLFRTKWYPVCSDLLDETKVNSICQQMKLGGSGTSLSTNTSIPSGFTVDCETDCLIRRSLFCSRQARISCKSEDGTHSASQCGLRYVEVNAREAGRSRVARVVGGFETVPGAFPWTAALRMKLTKTHHCGASVLDRTHLITAAHCFEEDERVSSYEVVVGDWDNNKTDGNEQIFPLQRINFYPSYKDIFTHDIAILEVPYPGIEFNMFAQPICLPSNDFIYTPGRQCVVSGWGSMGLRYAQRLQAALIPIIDRSECVNSSQIYTSMSRSAFCAGYLEGGIDSCQGDSGGPFACRKPDGAFVLAGVISWGDGCAQKKQPGIYTMVAPYLSWINSVITSS